MSATIAIRAALLWALLQVPAAPEVPESGQRAFVLEQIWRQEAICGQPHLLGDRTQFVVERCDGANEVRDIRTGAFVRSLPAGPIWMVNGDWVSITSEDEVILLDARDWRRQRLSVGPEAATTESTVPYISAPDGHSAVGSDGRGGVFEWRLDRRSSRFGQWIAWDEAGPTNYSTGVIAYAPDSSFLARIVLRDRHQQLVLGARLSGHDSLAAPIPGASVFSLAVGPRNDVVATLASTGAVNVFQLVTTDAPLPIEIRHVSSFESGARLRPAEAHFILFAGDERLLIGDDAGEISVWSLDGSPVWRRRVGRFSSAPVVDFQHNALLILAGGALLAIDLTTGDPIAVAAPDAFETGAMSSSGYAVTVAAQPEASMREIEMPMVGWRMRRQD